MNRSAPADILTKTRSGRSVFVDLSHDVVEGMQTYPGLPAPQLSDHLTREMAEEQYGPGVTFVIGIATLCTNTGTYIDVPFHRFEGGYDLADLDLERIADVPALCLDYRGREEIEIEAADLVAAGGKAVLIRSDHSRRWSTPEYFVAHPYLTASSADALVDAGVACVGIDSLNIDDMGDSTRPVHTRLLGAGIPVVEHLTGLARLPRSGFRFTAVPPKIRHAGTFTVRAFATVADGDE